MPDIPRSSSGGCPPGRYYATGRCLWERVKVKEHRVHSSGTCSEGLWDRWSPSWQRPASGWCSLQGRSLTYVWRYTTLLTLILLSHPWKWTCVCKALALLQSFCKVCISRSGLETLITKLSQTISWLDILWPSIDLCFIWSGRTKFNHLNT